MKKTNCGIDITLPDELFVGPGIAWHVKGWISHPHFKHKKVELVIGKTIFTMEEINYPREDIFNAFNENDPTVGTAKPRLCCGFSGFFDLLPRWEGQKKKIHFKATFRNNETFTFGEKMVYFQKREDYFTPLQIEHVYDRSKPLVSICMATYKPEIKAFKRQFDSIRAQSYTNWICIISDDCSDKKTAAAIQEVISDDPRFYFFQNHRNMGYYHNFERALRYIPSESHLIAFSDQDDVWYPDKLYRLTKKINNSTECLLVYSDMNIVDEDGKLISGTYWDSRTNYYKDLGMVLVANTITGAASLFKKKVWEKALPLPQFIEGAYHDHVIGCAAIASGKVDFIDKQLYEYVQHSQNVIGHIGLLNTGENSFSKLLVKNLKSFYYIRHGIQLLKYNYEINYLRLRLLSRSLDLRGCRAGGKLRLFNNRLSSVVKLLILHLRVKIRRLTTDDAELFISLSCLARKLYKYIH
jgi:glycosyltransferase involved in cell wall biosynthesis